MIEAFVSAGLPTPEQPPFLDHDLCMRCTAKALAHLGLPIKICEVPTLPAVAAPKDGNTGALTEEDLRALGLDPNTP